MAITAQIPSGYAIERIDLATASAELEAQLVALWQALEREQTPEDPDRPYAAVAAQFRTTSPLFERRQWGAFLDGRLVGGAFLGINHSGSNEDHREVGAFVLPEHRGRGLGRALFATAIEDIGEGQGILCNGWTNSRVPAGEAFAARVGATAALRMRTNQLDLATVDRALMSAWARLDPPGYRLEAIDDETPDRLVPNVITAFETMNTMPREGLQMEDWKMTPEMLRDQERVHKERGQEQWILLAIDDATGKTAAFTELRFDRRVPHLIWQGGTATVPEHRDKGLGKWVKGRMMVRILGELPAVRYVRTSNAGSNAPMLHINHAMGFQPAWQNTVWQMPLADAQRYVRR